MFNLTAALVGHAVKAWGLDAELAKDREGNAGAIREHLIKSIAAGEATMAEVEKLSREADRQSGEEILRSVIAESNASLAKSISESNASLIKELVNALRPQAAGGSSSDDDSSDDSPAPSGSKALGNQAPPQDDDESDEPGDSGPSPGNKAYNEHASGRVHVKGVKSFYRTDRIPIAKHPSLPAHFAETATSKGFGDEEISGSTLRDYSELDLAVVGATTKYLVHRSSVRYNQPCPRWAKMSDHDWDLMKYAANEMRWIGPVGMRGDDDENADYGFATGKNLSDIQTKAVLDDATSGGIEAVPIVFDDIAVLTPLLVSQLLPRVTMRTTTRRRVEGFRVANPDMYWTAEGTVPTEFDTAGFIGEFNTNIHPCVGWMEVGMDFMEDSPVDIANIIIGRYSLRARNVMENAIASGSGTGEPLGLTNTPGVITVNSVNGATGPLTVADFERLYHGMSVEMRQEAESLGSMAFVGNQINYGRAKGIAVGTSDQRRVFGMNQRENAIFGIDYAFNHSVPSTTLMNCAFHRYIMYRRAGFDVRRVTESSDLAKKNLELMVFRFRIGGQLNHGDALVKFTDGQPSA